MLRWGSWEALKLDRQQTSLLFLVVLKCLAGFALHMAEYLVGCQQSTSDVNQGISGSANNLPQVNIDTLDSVQKLRAAPKANSDDVAPPGSQEPCLHKGAELSRFKACCGCT